MPGRRRPSSRPSPSESASGGCPGDRRAGSRAGRYWGGFGAGAASSKATVEIVDAKSGKVLAIVTQARRAAGTFKGGGGSDLEVMRDSVHAMAKDIAHVLATFV